MLSLTDMWKAAGKPAEKRPDDWKKDASNRAFLDHVALISNTPVEGIWRGTRGNNGATFAHWQIGLAYAKYLSPEFHMWCNRQDTPRHLKRTFYVLLELMCQPAPRVRALLGVLGRSGIVQV